MKATVFTKEVNGKKIPLVKVLSTTLALAKKASDSIKALGLKPVDGVIDFPDDKFQIVGVQKGKYVNLYLTTVEEKKEAEQDDDLPFN